MFRQLVILRGVEAEWRQIEVNATIRSRIIMWKKVIHPIRDRNRVAEFDSTAVNL
jgi:hypothetical protein